MFNLIVTVGAILSYIYMRRVKSAVPTGQVVQDPLSSNERLYVWLLCLASPIVAGAVFYYGWKKVLPRKASSANAISITALLILIVVFYGLYFLTGLNPVGLPVPSAL